MVEWFTALEFRDVWRACSVLALAWLAVFFGKTLRGSEIPLIERIARVSDSELPAALHRYTRRLTALWCAYFLLAAVVTKTTHLPGAGAWVWLGTVLLFVGERVVRPVFFPGRIFPGLWHQLHDTWSVWRQPRNHPGDSAN